MEEEQKKKRGRPCVDGARRKRIFSHCNEQEYMIIEQAASIQDISIAELIRTSVYSTSKAVIQRREAELNKRFGNKNTDIFDENSVDYSDFE